MSEQEKHPAKLAAMKLFDREDVFYTEEETAEIIRREYAKQQQQWRPIESAPKTSKAILVFCPERRNTYAVTWSSNIKAWLYFGGSGELKESPAYWQPLPAPPTA